MKIIYKNILFLLLALGAFAPSQAQHWAETNGWSFDNFTTGDFDWNMFRESFIGVAPTQATSGNFDALFFDNVYKTLPNDGHCYGIDLLALMMLKHGGYLGYCHPPHIYPGVPNNGPDDPNLLKAIQLMHGQQLTHRFLLFLLDIVAQNKNRDGNYAYAQLEYYLAKDDPCIMSVTKSLNPADGGHAIIAYDVVDLGATKRIMIWDPNRTYYYAGADGRDYYDFGNNYIEITTATGAWNFTMAGPEVWSGSPGGGGNLVTIPLSVAGKRDRLPQSLFADVAEALTKIFVYADDAELEQITDEQGRRLFLPGTHEPDTSAMGMKNVMPFIPMTGGKRSPNSPKIYFYRGNAPIEISVKSKSGYRLDVMGTQGYVSLSAEKGQGLEHLRIAGINSATPELSLRSESDAGTHKLEIKALTGRQEPVRVYQIDDLKIEQSKQVDFCLRQEGNVLETFSKGSSISYNLQLRNTMEPEKEKPVIRKELMIQPGEKLLIQPQRWDMLNKGKLEIKRN